MLIWVCPGAIEHILDFDVIVAELRNVKPEVLSQTPVCKFKACYYKCQIIISEKEQVICINVCQ